MRGGFGSAGIHKHKWHRDPPVPKYAGKHGFKSLREEVKAINLSGLDALIEGLLGKGKMKESGKPFIDLGEMGYDKLLGGGRISRRVIVKVKAYSKKALEKLKASGGEIAVQ